MDVYGYYYLCFQILQSQTFLLRLEKIAIFNFIFKDLFCRSSHVGWMTMFVKQTFKTLTQNYGYFISFRQLQVISVYFTYNVDNILSDVII